MYKIKAKSLAVYDENGNKIPFDGFSVGEPGENSPAYPVQNMTEAAAEIQPNRFYVWPEMPALTVTLAPKHPDVVNEYVFQFVSGTSPTTLSVPDTVRWVQPLKVEAGKTYQVSIVNNVGVMAGA